MVSRREPLNPNQVFLPLEIDDAASKSSDPITIGFHNAHFVPFISRESDQGMEVVSPPNPKP